MVGYWHILARLFSSGSKHITPNLSESKLDNLRYIPNLKRSLVYTHNQVNRYKRIERSLDKLIPNLDLPRVFTAFSKLFNVINEHNIRASSKNDLNSPRAHNNNQPTLDTLRDFLVKSSKGKQEVEADHFTYPELVNKVYDKVKEFKFFFAKFVGFTDNLIIDDISLCELFRTAGLTYPTFVLFVWAIFLHASAGQPSTEGRKGTRDQLRELTTRFDRLVCDMFNLREHYLHKLNPYSSLPVVDFLKDLQTIQVFLSNFAKRMLELPNDADKVELSSSSKEDLRLSTQKIERESRSVDWPAINTAIAKVRCFKVDYGHNVKLKKQDLEKVIDYLE